MLPYREAVYEMLKERVTAEKVKAYFSDICRGEVTRYELDCIRALNFVLDKILGGVVKRVSEIVFVLREDCTYETVYLSL